MNNAAFALVASLLAVLACTAAAAERQTLDFDSGWHFHLGDIPFPPISTEQTFASAKTGNTGGAASYLYDDTTWRQLDLPNDWVVEGPFRPRRQQYHSYFRSRQRFSHRDRIRQAHGAGVRREVLHVEGIAAVYHIALGSYHLVRPDEKFMN